MSIYIITGVVSLLAVLGLLFYWLKKRKKSNHSTKYGGDMAEYGVQVARDNGQLVNLTDRPVMVMDVINVQYGVNGSRNFHTPVSCVGIDIDHDVDPASDGKTISVKYVGNSVTWTWHPAKALKPTNAKIIVFSGG